MPWHLSVGYRPFVDFCVWVLEVDGLHAGAFDRHPDGSSALRSAGMDEAGWTFWFSEVVHALDTREKTFRGRIGDITVRHQRQQRMEGLKWWTSSIPPLLWPGSPGVQHQLEILWEVFVPMVPNRRLISPGAIERTRATRGWRWARAFRRQIPSPLQVYYVAYPELVEYLQPPSSVILGLPPGAPAGQPALQARIMAAAARLAAANQATPPAPLDSPNDYAGIEPRGRQ